jgi:methylphosphotriester-DNA--protein-cysteine methyltransferase
MKRLVDGSISWPISADGTVSILGATCHITDHHAAEALIHRLEAVGLLVDDPEVAAVWHGAAASIPSRTLQRRFLAATGLSQQTVRQIHRARTALDLLRSGTTILDTVAQLGYSDQAHLTRSLTRWIGLTPASLVQERITKLA